MQSLHLITPSQAETLCREIIAELPEWFGIPSANEHYAKGCLERTSFAVKTDQEYTGMLTLEFPFANNANIFWMGVKRAYQGHQVGTALLNAAIQHCTDKGISSLTVETLSPMQQDPNYLKTYHFYEKVGFKPLFELKPYGPDLLMCYMQLNIR